MEDAPFVGALIVANACNNNCKGCFNQHLKNSKTYEKSAQDIIKEVKENIFNKGIILGGLEWSENPEDAILLIREAKKCGLGVIVYTGLNEVDFCNKISEDNLEGCFVKYGEYNEDMNCDTYTSCGVRLASTNQYIKFYSRSCDNIVV